jgi:ferredoxin
MAPLSKCSAAALPTASYDEARASGITSPGADPLRRASKKSIDGKFVGQRTKKPKLLAVVTDACTGCSGAPVCQIYCPVDDCMLLVPAEDAFPFGRIWVDPLKCVGCKKCVTRGPAETYLDGCPWDAIVMVSTTEWEKQHGTLAF